MPKTDRLALWRNGRCSTVILVTWILVDDANHQDRGGLPAAESGRFRMRLACLRPSSSSRPRPTAMPSTQARTSRYHHLAEITTGGPCQLPVGPQPQDRYQHYLEPRIETQSLPLSNTMPAPCKHGQLFPERTTAALANAHPHGSRRRRGPNTQAAFPLPAIPRQHSPPNRHRHRHRHHHRRHDLDI